MTRAPPRVSCWSASSDRRGDAQRRSLASPADAPVQTARPSYWLVRAGRLPVDNHAWGTTGWLVDGSRDGGAQRRVARRRRGVVGAPPRHLTLRWLGVDVGASRKGFDLAVIDEHRLLGLHSGVDRAGAVKTAQKMLPALVGVDSPRSCARTGQTARDCEREVNRRICGIRWTPDEQHVRRSEYYAWIVEGLALFEALAARRIRAIEVFPTASWTRWAGPRGAHTRATWTRSGLAGLDLEDIPPRTNQDQRDAIAAAVTARLHTQGLTEVIGEIVVPVSR